MRSRKINSPQPKLNREAKVAAVNDIEPRENILDISAWEAIKQLGSFVNDSEFFTKMATVFGENIDLKNISSAVLPSLQILPSDTLNGASGAYSNDTNTIYLSKEFINSNLENPQAIVDLLLEEIGHVIDNILNETDTPGDEGEHFAAVVNGLTLSPKEMNRIMSEDDSGTIVVDGKTIAIEQQVFNGTNGDDSLLGTAGDDTISPGLGRDTVDGADGNDLLVLDYSNSNGKGMRGYSGSTFDSYSSIGNLGSRDVISYRYVEQLNVTGTIANDKIKTGNGDDSIDGNNGGDLLNGKGGDDVIDGGIGHDSITGGGGHDILIGGAGKDELIGQLGQDTFVLLTDLTTDDRDIIRDFELGTDVLGVSDLAEVNDLSVANNYNNTASIVTGADGQQVAILQNITGVTMSDFDFVEI